MDRNKIIGIAEQQDIPNNDYMNYKSLSIKEVERHLGLCHSMVQKLLNQGELLSFKIGRRRFVSHIDLTNYIRKLRERGQIGSA